MPLPNFFVIGAAKSATTSLYHYLKQHPEIYLSPSKEPSFFMFENKKLFPNSLEPLSFEIPQRIRNDRTSNINDYMSLFDEVKEEKAIGEMSNVYLYHPYAAQRIYDYVPNAKLLTSFRNPFDAAYSHFKMQKRQGVPAVKYKSFLETLKAEDISAQNLFVAPYIIRFYLYDIQIERYFKIFPRHQIYCFLYEDLQKPWPFFQSMFQFLDVDDTFLPDISLQYNIGSRKLQRPLLEDTINKIPTFLRGKLSYILPSSFSKRYNNRRFGIDKENPAPSKCPAEAKEFLYPIFRPHILRLQDLIERDISSWLD